MGTVGLTRVTVTDVGVSRASENMYLILHFVWTEGAIAVRWVYLRPPAPFNVDRGNPNPEHYELSPFHALIFVKIVLLLDTRFEVSVRCKFSIIAAV